MGRDWVLPVRTSLISILRIHWESVVLVPPDKPFSVLQAVTQSLQPLAHLVLSINIPQRTLLLAPGLSVAVVDAAWAISMRRTPGAIKMPAMPAAANVMNPRRPDFTSLASLDADVGSGVMA
jgi:hypothetical protein